MRRLAVMFFAAVLLSACSSSIPRHPAVFTPTERPTAPPATASGQQAGGSPAASVDTSAWATLAPQGEGFSVRMPGQATSTTGPIKTPAGNATMTSWTYVDGNGRFFVVDRVTAPKGALAGSPAQEALDQVSATIAGTLAGAKISSQSDITLSGHSGRAVTFGNATTVVPCEFFVVGDDVYIVLLGHAAGSSDDALVQAYFASFQLTV